MKELKGRIIFEGTTKGEVLKTNEGISFYGGVDPDKGIIIERGHELEGKSIKGKILVFSEGKGSTVGSYALYRMKKAGTAPKGIINKECETIVAVGAIISEIPCIDKINIDELKTGQKVKIEKNKVIIET